MRFKHREGEDAAGKTVSVAPHLKPEVDEEGVFEVDEDELELRGVDPEAARTRLKQARHTPVEELEEAEDVSDSEDSDEGSEDSEPEEEAEEAPEEEDSEEEEDEEPDEEDAATKTELMNLKKDQLVTIGESFDDVDTDQNKEPLAEDLAGRVVLEDDEEGEE